MEVTEYKFVRKRFLAPPRNAEMPSFTRLIKFMADEDDRTFFADLESASTIPQIGTQIQAYPSYEDFTMRSNGELVAIKKLLAPVLDTEVPIYCVGLNYRSHASEANLDIPQYPPVWTKPKASLAEPEEEIPINRFCADKLLDYEGELVFITSEECRDLTPAQASSHVLGYTVGNDLSCRKFQLPGAAGGQFYFAKAFDKFAPMGPTLVSAQSFEQKSRKARLITKVNGRTVQECDCLQDLVFSPAQILSHMSQGTTIPAFTAVMTGTPAGVGVFRGGKGTFLKDGDVVEVGIDGIGTLKNKIVFV